MKSALSTDDEASITVTVARLCFSDHLFRLGELELALEVIQPSLDIECEQRKALVLMSARIHEAMGDKDAAETAARE